MQVIHTVSGAPKPVGPYSVAVKSRGMLYCAGQIGLNPETSKLVEGGIEAEVKQVLANLATVLEECGSGFDRVVMTTIFLNDITFGRVVNEIYAKAVSSSAPPARQTVAVKDLPMGALVEISVIAELAE